MYRCLGLLLALVPAFGLSAAGQFRDYQCGTTVTVGSERPITFLKDVVARADLIVRAGIGRGTSHLSKDAREIYTTYELVTPRVLFASPAVTQRFGVDSAEMRVMAQRGGTIFRDGRMDCPLSMSDPETTTLTPGMDAVLLVSMSVGKANMVGMAADGQFYGPIDGVFEVRDSAIVLPKAAPNDGEQFKGMPVDRFIAYVLALKENGR